jgi:hypothetical protein
MIKNINNAIFLRSIKYARLCRLERKKLQYGILASQDAYAFSIFNFSAYASMVARLTIKTQYRALQTPKNGIR